MACDRRIFLLIGSRRPDHYIIRFLLFTVNGRSNYPLAVAKDSKHTVCVRYVNESID
jgi:hypothetical protein